MKSLLSICALFCVVVLSCCSKPIVSPVTGMYKGDALHAPPPFGIFPNENNYNLTALSDSLLSGELDNNIENIISSAAINGLTMSLIIPNKGIWQIDTGYISLVDNTPVDDSTVFYWASVSKLITSTVIHQLMAEQKLNATDALSNWFPEFANAQVITIEHLLHHTNGIYSFNNDSTFHFSNTFHTPTELLAISLAEDNLFYPGEYWSYSNTGYVLLALIAEMIEGKSFPEIVEERIALPQNLSSLKALNPNEQPTNLALAHQQGQVIESYYSMPLGAGNVVSNSLDMSLFLLALLTGEYLPITAAHSMLDKLYPMFDNGLYYGSGIMLYDFNEINGAQDQWIGHSGGIEDYKSVLVYDIETKVICAVSVSQNIPVEAIANSMISVIND